MFAIVHLPFADLRPLRPGGMGRLPVPDWRAIDVKPGFLRGFGQIAARQSDSYGLLGERSFADCQNAIRFNAPIEHKQSDWPRRLTLTPWFRRLYFDGYSAGRFEIGFSLYGESEESITALGGSPFDATALAQTIRNAKTTIRALDDSETTTPLHGCGPALAMAYVLATTRNADLAGFPAAETVGSWVEIGPPVIQLRLEAALAAEPGRNARVLVNGVDDRLYVTSSRGGAYRNDVIVQVSPSPPLTELPKERARRVLFSHLNALIFSYAHMVDQSRLFDTNKSREELLRSVTRSIGYFNSYVSPDKRSAADALFGEAIHAFAQSQGGRIEELVGKLQELATALDQPTAVEKVASAGKGLMQLILTTGIKAAVEATMKGVR